MWHRPINPISIAVIQSYMECTCVIVVQVYTGCYIIVLCYLYCVISHKLRGIHGGV